MRSVTISVSCELDDAAQANLVQQPERRVVGRGHGEIVTAAARLHSITVTDIGTGTRVFEAGPVRGSWRRLTSPDDVLELMDTTAEGVVACVADAGATFLAPIFDELTAVVCLSGTPLSHIGIVSREYQVPCVMAATLDARAGRRRRGRGRLLGRARRRADRVVTS